MVPEQLFQRSYLACLAPWTFAMHDLDKITFELGQISTDLQQFANPTERAAAWSQGLMIKDNLSEERISDQPCTAEPPVSSSATLSTVLTVVVAILGISSTLNVAQALRLVVLCLYQKTIGGHFFHTRRFFWGDQSWLSGGSEKDWESLERSMSWLLLLVGYWTGVRVPTLVGSYMN